MDNIWVLHPKTYSGIINESRKLILHPKLSELIIQKEGTKILDYGCGDGSLITLVDNKCEISLFDISNIVLSEAKKNLKDYKTTVYYDQSAIPKNYFDYVIFSLVIMTIPTKKDIKESLHAIYSSLQKNGTALIAITHPCFRQEIFSTFQTGYSQDKRFNYFEDGDKFEVLLRDSITNQTLTFHDYHWTLSTIINLITSCNLIIKNMFELPDKSGNNKYFNSRFSPYIILECIKATG